MNSSSDEYCVKKEDSPLSPAKDLFCSQDNSLQPKKSKPAHIFFQERNHISENSSISSEECAQNQEKEKLNFAKPVNLQKKRSVTFGNIFLSSNHSIKQQREVLKSMNIKELDSSSSESFQKLERKSANHPKEEQPESYFHRKVRVLETKFKKFKLQNETAFLKLTEENHKLKSKLATIRKFLSASHPSIYQKIENLQSQCLSNSDASEDSIFDQLSMPMISQIMEIKIEGKKLCDQIKEIQNLRNVQKAFSKKLLQELEQLKNSKHTQRRWSMQSYLFEMKLSDEQQQKQLKQYDKHLQTQITHSQLRECQECVKLKKHLISFNESLRKIKIN